MTGYHVKAISGINRLLFGSVRQDAAGVQAAEMADARQGALYFLANLSVEDVMPDISMTGTILHAAVGSEHVLEDLGGFANWTMSHAAAAHLTLGNQLLSAGHISLMVAQKIDREISDFLTKVLHKLSQVFGPYSQTVEGLLRKISVQGLSALAGKIIASIPGWNYVQIAGGIYDDVRKVLRNAYSVFMQLWSGYEVNLLGGHPDIIAAALARHSATSAAIGVVGLTRKGGKIAALATDGLTAVGSTIYTLIDTAVFAIVKFIEAKIQKYLLQRALKKAKKDWSIRESSVSMIYNHDRFSRWFRRAVIPCPVLAALVLRSGFVAHPYRFLRLFVADQSIVTQAAYGKGVKHIQQLKKVATEYVRVYSDQYEVQFAGQDGVVQSRLDQVVKGRPVVQSSMTALRQPTARQSAAPDLSEWVIL